MARVVIVGAGVVGVASAYLMCRAGHEVVLVDRNARPADGASHANGAQLSYAYGDALASPSLLAHLPQILLGRDPAYRASLQADPEFLVWGLRFLANCLPSRFVANTRHLLEMAAATSRILAELLNEFALSFSYRPAGKMILYPSTASCDGAESIGRVKRAMGIRQERLSRAEATAIEPALDLYPDPIGGVIYSPDDAVGQPAAFCAALVERLRERYGLRTLFGQEATGLISRNGRVAGLSFRSRQPLECDVVVAASGYSTGFLGRRDRSVGTVWPVQGYSMTGKATPAAMQVSVTDTQRKLVFARLGDEVRIAGLADIGPRRFQFDAERFDTFRTAATAAFGGAFQPGDDVQAWSDARPCTPSSRPVIRRGSLSGLYLNLGHGTLGWTLCLGSAERLMTLVQGSAKAGG